MGDRTCAARLGNGHVVVSSGARPAALLAKERHVPVYCHPFSFHDSTCRVSISCLQSCQPVKFKNFETCTVDMHTHHYAGNVHSFVWRSVFPSVRSGDLFSLWLDMFLSLPCLYCSIQNIIIFTVQTENTQTINTRV